MHFRKRHLHRQLPGRAEHQRPQRPRVGAGQRRHRRAVLRVADVEGGTAAITIAAAFATQQPRTLVQE